jgi:hypothetical protein
VLRAGNVSLNASANTAFIAGKSAMSSEYVHDDLDGAFRLACDVASDEFARRIACDLTREENEVAGDNGVRIRAVCLGHCRVGEGMPFDCLHVCHLRTSDN